VNRSPSESPKREWLAGWFPARSARRRTGQAAVPATESLEVRLALSGVSTNTEEQTGSRSAPAATPQAAVGDRVNFLRTFNPNANLHFFTTREVEYANVLKAGFNDESSGRSVFAVLQNVDPGAAAIQRLYNPNTGEHYYTLSEGERDFLVTKGWTAEGTEGAAFGSTQPGTAEIFHLYNTATGSHLFTTNGGERNAVAALPGWQTHTSLGFGFVAAANAPKLGLNLSSEKLLSSDVNTLLERASAATSSNDAIIAIVDRGGHILGVRVEAGVNYGNDTSKLVFMVDGAVAKARTGAFFGNNEAPLTSRTIRNISQTTLTQSEIESNPNDPNRRGPGFVGIVGVGGHFLPGVTNVPHVDLFGIEHTNRDSLLMPGSDGIKGTPDDVNLTSRFNATYIPGKEIDAPESFGRTSGLLPTAQSRGIATIPGGVPIYKNGELVGGVGVFFPGPDGYATFEQGFVAGIGQTNDQRLNAPKVLEAEFIAAATVNLDLVVGRPLPPSVPRLNSVLPVPKVLEQTPIEQIRIDLVGINLETFGPVAGIEGVNSLFDFGTPLVGAGMSSTNVAANALSPLFTNGVQGQPVPSGWLVAPKASTTDPELTAALVEQTIMRGVADAERVRAQIRLPLGTKTDMVLSVADRDGVVLGLFRMPDATIFSIDVAVAKARNTAYYADPTSLNPVDQVPGVPAGTAFTNRTVRYLAEPRYPSGIDGSQPPPFSTLNEVGVNPATAENLAGFVSPLNYTTVLGFDAGRVGRNFRDNSSTLDKQNGIVFFPGSTALYVGNKLIGGFGVSGDGVDQDDVVTVGGAKGLLPPAQFAADQQFFRGVRLTTFKFPRNPFA
jgi:uncharacterized protein GlcG (DUF336 family)